MSWNIDTQQHSLGDSSQLGSFLEFRFFFESHGVDPRKSTTARIYLDQEETLTL